MSLIEKNGNENSSIVNLSPKAIKWGAIISVVVSILLFVGNLFGWVFNRGGEEKEFKLSVLQVKQNTECINSLKEKIGDYPQIKHEVSKNTSTLDAVKEDLSEIKTFMGITNTRLEVIKEGIDDLKEEKKNAK